MEAALSSCSACSVLLMSQALPLVSERWKIVPAARENTPDRLDPNSGTGSAFLALARNEDVFFKLGWHIVKNRKFKESRYSNVERNLSKDKFFRDSNWKELPPNRCGIEALQVRLSSLLFNHIKRQFPTLRQDLDAALIETDGQLDKLGSQRATT